MTETVKFPYHLFVVASSVELLGWLFHSQQICCQLPGNISVRRLLSVKFLIVKSKYNDLQTNDIGVKERKLKNTSEKIEDIAKPTNKEETEKVCPTYIKNFFSF